MDAVNNRNAANLLAEVSDDHIEQLLATRETERQRVAELEQLLADARSDLADTNNAIGKWVADLRAELHRGSL